MIKFSISLMVVFSIHLGYSQTPQEPKFFAQCMLVLNSHEEAEQLTLDLKENPYVEIARVDWLTKRVFVLTKNTSNFTEANFISWLGSFASAASCIQVGLHGVDVVQPYPFVNCNE